MEKMVMSFDNVYEGTRVLVTGHTGFKGSWLCAWLTSLGARVCGFALDAPTRPSHFDLLDLEMDSIIGDIRSGDGITGACRRFEPEIVFHLAAQPLVQYSYAHPVETFETNVMGTVHLLEACRQTASVRCIVNVTSDKCYENNEWLWGYRENDPVGGDDPYSCSKGCAELVTAAYRKSFFSSLSAGEGNGVLLASARAGNVIGGGDWARDRIIPDLVRSAFEGEPLTIRNPDAVRPWQHVLDPLCGYLMLGQKLLKRRSDYAGAWNFGPAEEKFLSVGALVETAEKRGLAGAVSMTGAGEMNHEARLLKLDSSKARSMLRWQPVWDTDAAIEKTVDWYNAFYKEDRIISREQINAYTEQAKHDGQGWA